MLCVYKFRGRRLLPLATLFWWMMQGGGLSTAHAQTTVFSESFEAAVKQDYLPGSVTLGSGSWSFDEAILANSGLDRKNGQQSVRLRQRGKLTMEFTLPNGAGMVQVQHGVYGTGGSSAWELWAMRDDNCNKWVKLGSTVITSEGKLQTALFAANMPGPVKLEIRKVTGTGSELNIDDLSVSDFGSTLGEQYPDNDHMALGNPSGAKADLSDPNNYLMRKGEYALSYSRDRVTPNWVSWHLDASDNVINVRTDNFREDPALPAGWYRANGDSYRSSGFDRGHNVPSADRQANTQDNDATFLMTNIIPQAPLHNQGIWNDLEAYARSFLPNNEVYIIMGSYGQGGTGANGGITNTIDGGRITVPGRIWKVLVILPVGDNDLSRIGAGTRIIAVDTPNDNNIRSPWSLYRTSIDAIEAATGLDLLSNLPTSVQTVVESKVDNTVIN